MMTFNQAHNAGVRRVITLAKQCALIIEGEAGASTARNDHQIEALRVLAEQAETLLLPTPNPTRRDERGRLMADVIDVPGKGAPPRMPSRDEQ